MQSNVVRVIVGVAVVALAVVLLVVLKDSGSEGKEATTKSAKPKGQGSAAKNQAKSEKQEIPTIVVRAGEPVGGVAELDYDQGERVRFKVTSDVADEIHLHGYDISKEVEAGGSATFDFPAEIEGIFEVELEQRAVQIAELTVEP